MAGEHQFEKWQWISAQCHRSTRDNRPESHKIEAGSILVKNKIDTKDGWDRRIELLKPHFCHSASELEQRRQSEGTTLGFVVPSRMIELQITPNSDPDWTDEERLALAREDLFDPEDVKNRRILEKPAHNFHYLYECDNNGTTELNKHKITDWEIIRLYFRCRKDYGDAWEHQFRKKIEDQFFNQKDLFFMLGTIHRFPNQWLIIGVYYPPKGALKKPKQLDLGL